jgi:PIN domain nuclease of toxin-antitoxin system
LKYLLDTHVFLWAITEDRRLKSVHRKIYADGDNELWLSVASLWEILIKTRVGKLTLPAPVAAYILKQMEKNRVSLLPVRASHLVALEELPPLHRDPFDRMLVAQANGEGMAILSGDAAIRKYAVTVV